MVSRSIETAQRKVEARNFDIRKQLLEYDDVANDQRKVIYAQRNDVLESAGVGDTVTAAIPNKAATAIRVNIESSPGVGLSFVFSLGQRVATANVQNHRPRRLAPFHIGL